MSGRMLGSYLKKGKESKSYGRKLIPILPRLCSCASQSTPSPAMHWLMGMIKKGAALAACPHHIHRAVKDCEAMARLVRLRLAAINLHVLKLKGSEPRLAREKPPPRPSKLASLRAASEHVLVKIGQASVCARCRARVPKNRLARFLAQVPCVPVVEEHRGGVQVRPSVPASRSTAIGSKEIHESHMVAQWRGWWWCWRCGSNGAYRLMALALPCKGGPTPKGRDALGRLRRGLTPVSGRHWPSELQEGAFPAPPAA